MMYAAAGRAALPKGYGRGAAGAARQAPLCADTARRSPPRRRGARREFPHRGRRGRHPRLQPRHPPRRHRTRWPSSPISASRATARHAFYLGAELAKAEIAWRLGKRYVQDEPLDWGAAADDEAEDTTAFKKAGHTKHSGPGAPPPGTRDATPAEADAKPPETIEPEQARAQADAVAPAAAGQPMRIVCGKLVPAEGN